MIERMRAPLAVENDAGLSHDDDTSDDDEGNEKKSGIPGTFTEGLTPISSTGSYF